MNNKKSNKIGSSNVLSSLVALIKRHCKVFFKNKATVLFTLMVPLAILVVYALFLRPMEITQIDNAFLSNGTPLENLTSHDRRQIYGIVDTWMMAGIISTTCFTVSLNTNNILVRDKESGNSRDFISSPIKSSVITASYFLFNAIVTFVINFIVYLICLAWLAGYGGNTYYLMPGWDGFFAIIGIIILSTLNSSLVTFFICSFLKSESSMGSMTAIFSTIIGFLNGAYLPASMMPKSIQYVTEFFPGTYSSGLFRQYFMKHPIEKVTYMLQNMANNPEYANIPNVEKYGNLINNIKESFPSSLYFFNYEVTPSWMVAILLIFIVIFLVLNLIFSNANIVSFFSISKKIKKNKKNKAPEEAITTNHIDEATHKEENIKN